MNRCQQHRDHIKTDLSNLLSQVKQHGDNDNNECCKNIDDVFQTFTVFNNTNILNIIDSCNNNALSVKNAPVSTDVSTKESQIENINEDAIMDVQHSDDRKMDISNCLPCVPIHHDDENLIPQINQARFKLYCLACGCAGHTKELYNARGPIFQHPILQRRIKQINQLFGEKTTKPLREPKLRPLPPHLLENNNNNNNLQQPASEANPSSNTVSFFRRIFYYRVS